MIKKFILAILLVSFVASLPTQSNAGINKRVLQAFKGSYRGTGLLVQVIDGVTYRSFQPCTAKIDGSPRNYARVFRTTYGLTTSNVSLRGSKKRGRLRARGIGPYTNPETDAAEQIYVSLKGKLRRSKRGRKFSYSGTLQQGSYQYFAFRCKAKSRK